MKRTIALILGIVFLSSTSIALADKNDKGGPKGLNRHAKQELIAAGVNKYLGDFAPVASVPFGDGWIKHTFDPAGGAGPICIAGTPYSVFTKERNPKKLLIFMQGGGACWQDFYFCNVLAESQEPPPAFFLNGIFDESMPDNPLGDYSIAYLPYCDGSVFSGDNDVVDANFPFGPVRFHRGLRNASAGIDAAKAVFPKAKRIVLAGSSAGGVGVAGFAPFLVRMTFGNRRMLSVFNDAGPVAINLFDAVGITARAKDWLFQQFYPASCVACQNLFAQGTEIIKWRLDNDRSIREAFYSTDADGTNRFFLQVPTQALYRALIVSEHGAINALHPGRYKSFIRSGDDEHTALQLPQFYSYEIDGVPLDQWTRDFLKPGKCSDRGRKDDDDDDEDDDDDDDDNRKRKKCVWVDLVEDFIPLP